MRILILASSLLSVAAFAGAPSDPPATYVERSVQLQGQQQAQAAEAAADASARSASNSSATGGDATGGAADARSNQAVSLNTAAQVGLLYLPAVIPPACGAAVSAGHSNTHNATALGVAWTTERCWSVVVATDYERMGDYETACELRKDVVRRQLKRLKRKVDCAQVAASIRASLEKQSSSAALVPPELDSRYVTQEHLRRAFEAAQKK